MYVAETTPNQTRSSKETISAPAPVEVAPVSPPRRTHTEGHIVLPFVDRPTEVAELLFETPCNATLARRLKTLWVANSDASNELRHLLHDTKRVELDDVAWVNRLREVVTALKPDIWPDLERTLDAQDVPRAGAPRSDRLSFSAPLSPGQTSVDGPTWKSPRHRSHSNDSSTSCDTTDTHDGVRTLNSLRLSSIRPADKLAAHGDVDEQSSCQATGATLHLPHHRHQPSMSAGESSTSNPKHPLITLPAITATLVRDATSNNPAGVSTPSAEKSLRSARPLGTPTTDDGELLTPQKSKYSFARTFEGPTLANARKGMRPKAYSMTQYSSNVEQFRLDKGREGDIAPCEVAAKLEEKGEEKPVDLGVLEDGRTKHPFVAASSPQKSARIVTLHPAIAITPADRSQGSPSPGGSPSRSPSAEREHDRANPATSHTIPSVGTSLSRLDTSKARETSQSTSPKQPSPPPNTAQSPSSSPFLNRGGSGFALGGGFFKAPQSPPLQQPTLRRSSSHSPSTTSLAPSSAPSTSRDPQSPLFDFSPPSRKQVSWSQDTYRQPASTNSSLVSFSSDAASARRRRHSRSVSENSVAFSPGTQVKPVVKKMSYGGFEAVDRVSRE